MSSDVQSALAQQRSNDYGSLVIAIAISYDYCLTFSKEVTYIWTRPWTWVSTLYLLIRYAGYLSVIIAALFGSTFIPGPTMAKIGYFKGNIAYLLGTWAYPIFWAGADLVMILRVYAMYNRSRIILCVLLMIYATELVILFVSSGIYSDPNYVTVLTAQLLDITVCNTIFNTQTWNNASTIMQFILGTVMCILVAAQFAQHLFQMHRTTRKWQLNRYMRLLIRDGLLYFLVTLFYSLLNMLGILGKIPLGLPTQILMAAANVPLYTLTPRFVMNVRELYVRDSEGRQESRDRDIDTGFGLSSGVGRGVGKSATMGTIAFAEVGGVEESVGVEEIVMEEGAEGSGRQQ